MRLAAEGSGLTVADIAAIHLFLTDPGFHRALCSAWVTLAANQPVAEEAEQAMELQAALMQVGHALHAIPAKKTICYRACRLAVPGGCLREFLLGGRHTLDCYRPGSFVLWRHAASATTDPGLAEEAALRGEPWSPSACGIVFKVRRAV